ncbi:MAG: hypothetical protein KJ077_27290 [Anaerolineae bacterium]|nr:hypothetical protein [Anaerolineae bacterium]
MDLVCKATMPGNLDTFSTHVTGLQSDGDISALMEQYEEFVCFRGPTYVGNFIRYVILITPWDIYCRWQSLVDSVVVQSAAAKKAKLSPENRERMLRPFWTARNEFKPKLKAATLEIGVEASERAPGVLTVCFRDNQWPEGRLTPDEPETLEIKELRPIVFALIEAIAPTSSDSASAKGNDKAQLTKPELPPALADLYPNTTRLMPFARPGFIEGWLGQGDKRKEDLEKILTMIKAGCNQYEIENELTLEKSTVSKWLSGKDRVSIGLTMEQVRYHLSSS